MSEIQGEGIEDLLNCLWQAAHVISVILTNRACVHLRQADLRTFQVFHGVQTGMEEKIKTIFGCICILNASTSQRTKGRRPFVTEESQKKNIYVNSAWSELVLVDVGD